MNYFIWLVDLMTTGYNSKYTKYHTLEVYTACLTIDQRKRIIDYWESQTFKGGKL